MNYASTQNRGGVETVVLVLPLSVVPGFNPENPPQENTYGVPDDVEVGWVKQTDGTFAPAVPPSPTPEQIIASLTAQIQARLDDFAKTRNYDGILSACTYATSTVPKFATEGQYCVQARDATWAAGYALMDEVLAGSRPVPSSIADIESELPALAWPT
jgi:hypothetical protein